MSWFGGSGPTLRNPTGKILPSTQERGAKAVIEGIDPSTGKTRWIDATPQTASQHGIQFNQLGPEAVSAFDSRHRQSQIAAELKAGKAADRKRDDLAADREYQLDDRRIGVAEQQTANTHEINQQQVGVTQQRANTEEVQVRGALSNDGRRLDITERELAQRGQQFDQTHLLSQQQSAMNYNLGVHALNERMDNAEQDRRLRTMEGIGAAIAGLAAMIGG